MSDILIRAGKTFVQSAASAALIALASGVNFLDKGAAMAFITGVLAAGISAAWNTIGTAFSNNNVEG